MCNAHSTNKVQRQDHSKDWIKQTILQVHTGSSKSVKQAILQVHTGSSKSVKQAILQVHTGSSGTYW